MSGQSPVAAAVVAVAGGATRLLRMARETVALDRRYSAGELAEVIAWLLDDGADKSLSAAVTAQAEGDSVIVVLRHHDGWFGRTSEVAQEFLVTVEPRGEFVL